MVSFTTRPGNVEATSNVHRGSPYFFFLFFLFFSIIPHRVWTHDMICFPSGFLPSSPSTPRKALCPAEPSRTSPDDDVLIAVMGATGSGKTTFINMASKSNLRIGRGLESCTHIVQIATPFMLDGRRVTLIDTPGFDDTKKSDTDILGMIALYLSTAYETGKKLSGVVYMHRISDFRVGGISRRNFKVFRELCGDDNLKNVLIVTNMWGEVDPQVGLDREKELTSKDLFFKPAVDKGARFLRHENTTKSAYNIIRQVMRNRPLPLQIQAELVDQKKDISETAAGIELTKELREQVEKHRKEIVELQKEMIAAINAKDEETKRELEIETRKLQQEIERIQRESSTLAENYNLEKAKMEAYTKTAQLEAEKAAERHRRQMEALEERLRDTETRMTRKRDKLKKAAESHKQQTQKLERRLGKIEAKMTLERSELQKAAESHKQETRKLEQQLHDAEASMVHERDKLQALMKEKEREYANSRRQGGDGFFAKVGEIMDTFFKK